MRTVIDWTFWVWKSSVEAEIAKTGFPTIKEVARDVILAFGKTPQEMTHKEKVQFQTQVYAKQRAEEKNLHDVLIDWSCHRNVAFTYFVCKDLRRTLRQHLRDTHEWYDEVLLFESWQFKIKDDWIRFIDPVFQKQVEMQLIEEYKYAGIDFKTVRGSIKERTNEVLSIINS